MKSFKDIYELFGIKESSAPKNEDNSNKVLNDTDKATLDLASYIDSKRSENKRLETEEATLLEDKRIEEITSMDLPSDFENLWAADERAQGVFSESIDNGLILSLCNLGRVDIEYIASITGQEYKTVILSLKGSIYQDPDCWDECFYKGWKTADEYLSGNLISKLRIAKSANEKYRGYFSDNVEALEALLPPSIPTDDIYITLGSPWVPTDIIDDFITHLLGEAIMNLSQTASATKHDEETGIWEIPFKSRYRTTRFAGRSVNTYGTRRLEALTIIEKTLNQKTIAIYDEEFLPHSTRKIRKLNQEETLLAIEKQSLIVNDFKQWVWLDEKRKERLLKTYEDRYSSNRVRHFDGSFLSFPGLNPEIKLYPYQKNAVARILFTPNTLLAHDVGSGKTYIMIAAGMELRRTGISKKNVYVVPNNLVGQWRDIFLNMYKDANVLTVEPKDFTPAKRYDTLKKIRDNDYDGIIIAYSSFELIPMSFEHRARVVEDKIEEYKRASSKLHSDKFAKQRERLQKELFEAHVSKRGENDIFFDELKINTIFVDEAHNYKNVPVNTQIERILGISSDGSAKCQDMLEKIYHVQKTNGGRGTVLATGTPITNSVTDAFVMQKYLQSGELKMLGLSNFDGWVGMFAEKHTEFEIDIDTGSYRLATRFSRFHNLPELTSLFSSVADFHIVDKSVGVPDFNGYTDTVTARSHHFNDYLKVISRRADDVRSGRVARNVDNLLLITTDGRKAALDMRLIDHSLILKPGSKVDKCADNVYEIYQKYGSINATQLIFCDYSTPKATFNLYDELKLLLVRRGIPENEIEYIHNAKSEKAREKLFKSMREGKIRILIGSTFKLGLGVNVQDKLIAIHHLDVPWRPADMTQREGRILRQGNTNEEIFIYRYITEGSFDAYSWQLLETKQRFISSLLSGHLSERDGSDISDIVLNYAEIKAIAVGNPKVKERVEIANELDRQIILRRERIKQNEILAQELNSLPTKLANQEKLLMSAYEDLTTLHDEDRYVKLSTKEKELLAEERRDIRDRLDEALSNNVLKTEETELFDYRGFKIILPAGMRKEEPYVWLTGSGRYLVELGDGKMGYFIRIDNFLDSFTKHIGKLKDGLSYLAGRREHIEATLSTPDLYSDNIERLKKRLEEIDKELGVKKK